MTRSEPYFIWYRPKSLRDKKNAAVQMLSVEKQFTKETLDWSLFEYIGYVV